MTLTVFTYSASLNVPSFLSQTLDVDIKDRRRVSQPADSVREFYGMVTINQIQINVDISFFQER